MAPQRPRRRLFATYSSARRRQWQEGPGLVAILRLCSRSSGYFFIPAAIFMNSSVMNVFGSGFSLSVPAEMK